MPLTMTSRERLLAVLHGEPPDCVPCCPDISKIVRWRAEYGGMKGRDEVKQARVVVVDASGAKVGQHATDKFKAFTTEQQFAIDKLADGNYVVQLFLDATGQRNSGGPGR